MSIQELNSYYSDLISRYLSGNATDQEVQELEAWVLADPENKKLFTASKKAWMLSGMKQNAVAVNVDQLWAQTAKGLTNTTPVVNLNPQKSRRRWLAAAAAITLLGVVSFLIWQNLNVEQPMLVSTTTEVKSFDLPDGSHITLNQSSTLDFQPDVQRKVDLKGDAFFDVVRDEKRPFIIQAEGVEIEVLGTSFYVDARENQEEVQVTVESGSVAVRAGNEETILEAGEKAIFEKEEGTLMKESTEDDNHLSLKNKTIVFNNTRVEDAVFVLNRQYNANISIENPVLNDCEITATYKDKSLEAVLTLIEASFPAIKINRTGSAIILSGNSCK